MTVIRQMQIDDLEQVMPIERELFSVPWTETGFFTFLMREGALFLVAEEEGKIQGYCGVIMAADEGDITNVAVSGQYHRRGIGTLLVKELMSQCASMGIRELFLEVRESNEAARKLYEKLGFEEIGVRKLYYQEPAEDAVLMKGQLT